MNSRAVRSLLLVSVLMFVQAAPAGNSPDPPTLPLLTDETPRVEILRVDFGFAGSDLPGYQFAPVTVWLTSREKAASGTLSISVQQNSLQPASVSTSFATTPGRVTPHQLCVLAASGFNELTIGLDDGRGPLGVRITRDGVIGRQQLQTTLPTCTVGVTRILTIGDCRYASESLTDLAAIDPSPPRSADASDAVPTPGEDFRRAASQIWSTCTVTELSPLLMPSAWIAYDAISLVIINANIIPSCDPAALEALLTWRDAGGKLLVIPDEAGVYWQRLFPPDQPLPIEVDSQSTLTTGTRLSSYISGVDLSDTGNLIFQPFQASRLQTSTTETAPTRTATGFPGRAINITSDGIQHGWQVRWEGYADGPSLNARKAVALYACGPVGCGLTGLLSAPPHIVAPQLHQKLTSLLYRDAAWALLPTHRKELSSGLGDRDPWSAYSLVPDQQAASAISAAMQLFHRLPSFGSGAFIVIVAAMVLLAVALFAVDGFIIRKRSKHASRTFASAALWIFVASVSAGLAPLLFRSGQTFISRVSFVDCTPLQSEVNGYQSGITGLFAGRPMRVEIEGAAPGAWFRTISIADSYDANPRLAQPFRLLLSDRAGATRSGLPAAMPLQQWTFHSFTDQSPRSAESINVRLHADRDDCIEVKCQNEGEYVLQGVVEQFDPQLFLEDRSLHPALKTFASPAETVRPLPSDGKLSPDAWTQLTLTSTTDMRRLSGEELRRGSFQSSKPMASPANLSRWFPAARDRSDAFDYYLQGEPAADGGRWAIAYIMTERPTPNLTISGAEPSTLKQLTYYRVLIRVRG